MVRRLLIANRGEIACRVIATARRMGLGTVAVHSDADARARHVTMADIAVRIGPAPASESYLDGAAILDAALQTGADAIHPGYGFLSESPDFAQAVDDAGLVFVGPPAAAIRAAGLKDRAKAMMEAAGVPVVPGYHGTAQDPETLASEAARIGYPVMIKACAGGGGKGMRIVEAPEAFAAALAGAQREAQASFGDPRVLIERVVRHPRHVEMQVLADDHGNVVHLFERDCSLQRRHQKVIEEAPAPGMTDETRAAMGHAAVEAARAIGYRGAGTVEFIADGRSGLRPDGFWFMEMNTRLQVEHPVTEAVTGLDLVEWQLRIAAGEPLGFGQEDLAIDGHAVEARLYAEDPGAGFLPATGRIAHLVLPAAAEFRPGSVRIDAGVASGDVIGTWYDPMMGKLIAHGVTRDEALRRLGAALRETEIAGVTTNVAFLDRLIAHPDFVAGSHDTGLIAQALADLTRTEPPSEPAVAVGVLAAAGLLPAERHGGVWTALTGWRAWGVAEIDVAVDLGGDRLDRRVRVLGPDRYEVTGPDGSTPVRIHDRDTAAIVVECAGVRRRVGLVVKDRAVTVFEDGRAIVFARIDPLDRPEGGHAGDDTLRAPMPGLVVAVAGGAGRPVRAGEVIVTLEAMKMEHALTAPRDGVIGTLPVAVGDRVEEGAELAVLEPADD